MSIFFTADTHFCHGAIIRHCFRPWLSASDLDENNKWVSKEIEIQRTNEMNEALIKNWNEVVRPGDIVYHCGDFAFAKGSSGRDNIQAIVKRLNGEIQLMCGNHDKKNTIGKLKGFSWVGDTKLIHVDRQLIFLSHYAHRVWDQSHRGSWNLYGHSHGNLVDRPNMLATDVGVERWEYRPVAFDTLRDFLKDREFTPYKLREESKNE